MSSVLFVLCMEYLSRLLKIRTENTEFNFHAKCKNAKITHLAFADDLMLFGRGDFTSMKILADALGEFSTVSGLEVNQAKSQLFAACIDGTELLRIRDMFGFPSPTFRFNIWASHYHLASSISCTTPPLLNKYLRSSAGGQSVLYR